MTTTPQSMSDLPDLPEPSINTANHASVRVIGYTADQLREYCHLCRATAEQAGKVEGLERFSPSISDYPGNHFEDAEPIMVPTTDGDYIRYEDALRLLAKPAQPAATQQPVASLTVSLFRGHLENTELDYFGTLPPGTHQLYAAPVSPSREVEALERAAKVCESMVVVGRSWSESQQLAADALLAAAKNIRLLAPVQEKAP